MAATKKKSTAKAKSTKATASKAAAPKAWVGVSKAKARLGQTLTVSWRVADKDRTMVSLWQEGPDGNFHFTVPPKGSLPVHLEVAGTYAWSIRAIDGEEVARVEVPVKT